MARQVWQFNQVAIQADPNQIVSKMLSNRGDIQYWSADALKLLYQDTLKLAIAFANQIREELKGGEKAKLTRFISKTKRKLQHVPEERQDLLIRIYNEILTCEGHGPLRGFGIGNQYGDKLVGDPERQSIRPKRSLIMAKKKEVQLTKKKVLAAAKELNKVLELTEPEIELNGNMEKLCEQIGEAGTLITDDDDISKATMAVVEAIPKPKKDKKEKMPKPPKEEKKKEGKKKESKAAKTGGKKKGKKRGVGAAVRELLSTKKGWKRDNEDVAKEAKKQFPDSAVCTAHIIRYRAMMRKEGIAPE